MRNADHRSMRSSAVLLGLIASAALLMSCNATGLLSQVVSYRVSPQVEPQSTQTATKRVTLYYRVNYEGDPLAGFEMIFEQPYEKFRSAFAEERRFVETIAVNAPPQRGLFCSVDLTTKPRSRSRGFSDFPLWLTMLSFQVIPYYDEESRYIVRYDLYLDGELKNTYRYEVTRETWIWLGLIPFVWINALTSSHGEALASTVDGFFHDAAQDGFFGRE